MWGNFAIDAAVAGLLVAAWYLWVRRANRRRSLRILRWIEGAFCGHGSIKGICWQSPSRFEVDLRLCPSIFRRASLAVQLEPREMPLNWALARLKKQRETVTFKAELDCRPAMNLHVQNHRWAGRTRRLKPASFEGWTFESLGPVLISTRPDWQQDARHMLDALIATRSCDFLHVAFRRKAPHFTACAPLESLCAEHGRAAMFDVLHELATTASTSKL